MYFFFAGIYNGHVCIAYIGNMMRHFILNES